MAADKLVERGAERFDVEITILVDGEHLVVDREVGGQLGEVPELLLQD